MRGTEGETAASIGDVGRLGDEFAFTLFDGQDREIAAFVFETEQDARAGAKMMQDILARTVAVSPAEGIGFVGVPVVKS
ncbi:MAG TPA: hypothetical protein VHX61_14545 [Rhizomicrobium sp.]|jgi:hypothetical protein|nr:hypothetical protein [Rhizomicrobium sp.]